MGRAARAAPAAGLRLAAALLAFAQRVGGTGSGCSLGVRMVKRGAAAWGNDSKEAAEALAQAGSTRLLAHSVAGGALKKYLPAAHAFLEDLWAKGRAG
eukprot:23163-Alexandrium_andersonii.AAC.1